MSKLIQFSAEEINELRSFYSAELASAEARIKHIRSVLSKIENSGSTTVTKTVRAELNGMSDSMAMPARKRGRPALKTKQAPDTSAQVTTPAKKRGRPSKIKNNEALVTVQVLKKRGRKAKSTPNPSEITGINSLVTQTAAKAEYKGKKRGRKPLSLSEKTSATAVSKPELKTSKRGPKPRKITTDVSTENKVVKTLIKTAKRGRKPSVAAVSDSKSTAEVKIKTLKRGRKAKASSEIKNSLPALLVAGNSKPARAGSKKAASAKVKSLPKVTITSSNAKSVSNKVGPAKVVTAKKSAKSIASTIKATPAKVEAAPKKVSKKVVYQEFIFKTFNSEPRFYTTEEIVSSGIKEFNLKGNEKDAAKNTMQFILNGLQSQGKILRRRKEKDRQAYWAALETSDEGYIK